VYAIYKDIPYPQLDITWLHPYEKRQFNQLATLYRRGTECDFYRAQDELLFYRQIEKAQRRLAACASVLLYPAVYIKDSDEMPLTEIIFLIMVSTGEVKVVTAMPRQIQSL